MAKIVLNENSFKKLLACEMLEEEITKREVSDMFKHDKDLEDRIKAVTKSALKNDKEMERQIKKIVSDVIIKYNRLLWQRNHFLGNELMN